MTTKVCPRCKETKLRECFNKNRSAKDGLDTYCNPCRKAIRDPEYHANYYRANKEKSAEYQKAWTEKNKEKVEAQRKERYQKNREHLLQQKKEYYQKNKESILEYKSTYQKVNRHKKNATEAKRHSAKLQRTPPWLSEDQEAEIESFYWLSKDLSRVTGEKYNVDHIVPLQGENVCGLHVPWNLQVLPSDVNISKGNKFDGWQESPPDSR